MNRVSQQRDLGVIFQENFEFNLQLRSVVSRAFKVLGLVIRSSGEFKSETLVYLYKTLVRPVLLYNSQIWSPHYNSHVILLESVQHKFFRHLAFRLGVPFAFDDHNYGEFSRSVSLCSIKSLHSYYDLLFVKRILSLALPNLGDCLVNLFKYRENKFNTRGHRILLESNSSRDYIFHSSVFRLRRAWNSLNLSSKFNIKMCEFKSLLFESVCKYE